ncbi:hypothetical protein B0H13DRAFT_1884551 [Mycena leptocephala]|nr:hypothetical protein B0H13DRAFT_1884551 [Mycena leptocephala]
MSPDRPGDLGRSRQPVFRFVFHAVNLWERLARQDRNKSQVEEYGRLLDEAMLHFSINLELGTHRLHLELAAAEPKRHADVLAVARMSESERLLLTQIRGRVLFVHVGMVSDSDLGDVHMGKSQFFGDEAICGATERSECAPSSALPTVQLRQYLARTTKGGPNNTQFHDKSPLVQKIYF